MTKEELIKELEELRDVENYSQSELLNTGYKTGLLDALDLVNKYFVLSPVMPSLPNGTKVLEALNKFKNMKEAIKQILKNNSWEMEKQDKEQLWIEIEHIFDSGANEIRVFNMVEAFIEKRYQALRQPPVIKAFACLDDKQECDKQCAACKFVEDGLKKQANVL